MSDAVRDVVSRWFAEEAAQDFPFIPPEWPEPCWALLVATYPSLRYWVAHQPYAPEAVVRTLAVDADCHVRARIAMKRNLPRDLFPPLAADPDPYVRTCVAANAKAPLELVAELARDPDENVASVAARNHGRRLQKEAARATARTAG